MKDGLEKLMAEVQPTVGSSIPWAVGPGCIRKLVKHDPGQARK